MSLKNYRNPSSEGFSSLTSFDRFIKSYDERRLVGIKRGHILSAHTWQQKRCSLSFVMFNQILKGFQLIHEITLNTMNTSLTSVSIFDHISKLYRRLALIHRASEFSLYFMKLELHDASSSTSVLIYS